MAGIHNGYITEFPQIRVDCFTSPPAPPNPPWLIPSTAGPSKPPIPAPPAQLYLLTHVHSDHLLGLTNDFTGHIVCSPDTKRMLLRLEWEREKQLMEKGGREVRRCKYDGLKARVVGKGTKTEHLVDRIEAVPYGLPKKYRLGYDGDAPVEVTITLLDANHCPGSTMFLITSADRAVLHTGDVRSDALFMQTLRRASALQEFICPYPGSVTDQGGSGNRRAGARRVLDRIYLDTSAMVGTGDMPDREPVLQALLGQMSLYPPGTVFFLNVWCFGWEDVVKEVARYFGELVHVDRYKRSIYGAIHSDPYLLASTTEVPTATRFHACERFARCKSCWRSPGRKVVEVSMVEEKSAAWDIAQQAFIEKLGAAAAGEDSWPHKIDCPIARHATLPELQNLVKLFRPQAISPNCLYPHLQGIDYFLLPGLFRDHMQPTGYEDLVRERDEWFRRTKKGAQLDRLREMQKAGGDAAALRWSLGLEDEDPERSSHSSAFVEASAASGPGRLDRGRKAAATDHMARLGGGETGGSADLDLIANQLDPPVTPSSCSMLEPGQAQPIVPFIALSLSRAVPQPSVVRENGEVVLRSKRDSDEDDDTDDEQRRHHGHRQRQRRRPDNARSRPPFPKRPKTVEVVSPTATLRYKPLDVIRKELRDRGFEPRRHSGDALRTGPDIERPPLEEARAVTSSRTMVPTRSQILTRLRPGHLQLLMVDREPELDGAE